MRTKTLYRCDAQKIDISRFPNFHITGSITGMKKLFEERKVSSINYSVCKENGNESEVIRCRSCDLWIILIFLFQHLEVQD